MIHPVTLFQVSCDFCSADLENEDELPLVFESSKEAADIAIDCGWREIQPCHWACPECLNHLKSDN